MLVLVASAGPAAAVDYRVRWRPSPTADVDAYNVYVRPVSQPGFGAPRNAGLPAVAADGSMAYVVAGLQAGVGYRFAVAAVRDGFIGALSNELGVCGTDADCVDGNQCTDDVCASGRCTNPAVADGAPCADANPCDGAETCRAGVCSAGTPLTCDDQNPCTSDDCSPTVGCTHSIVSGCQACTTSGVCSDGNPCNGTESCQGGFCRAGTPLSCSDGNACTADSCNLQTGCVHTPIAGCRTCVSSADCDDADACNGTETCVSGRCRDGVAPDCDDDDPCTTDSCAPATGCGHELLETCFACSTGSRATLRATRVTMKRSVYGIHYRASGMLEPTIPVDPTRTGLVFDLRHFQTGEIYYRAIVPGGALRKSRIGSLIRYDVKQKLPTAEGIRFLRIRPLRDGRLYVAVFGRAKRMPASFPVDLGWTLMVGDQCGADSCTAYPRRTECR